MTTSKKYEWDYCTLSPEKVFGVYIGNCCKQHDEEYLSQHITRKDSDKRLRDNIYNTYLIRNKKIYGWIVSRIYWFFVRIFGWLWWYF